MPAAREHRIGIVVDHVPSSPHSVTIGTGERSIRPTTVRTGSGQASMAPRDVVDQSKREMLPASLPPPFKKACLATSTPASVAADQVYRNPLQRSLNGDDPSPGEAPIYKPESLFALPLTQRRHRFVCNASASSCPRLRVP